MDCHSERSEESPHFDRITHASPRAAKKKRAAQKARALFLNP
jgi:hypothetical protein